MAADDEADAGSPFGAGGDASSIGPDGSSAPSAEKSFTGSDADLLNPERGFYAGVDLIGNPGAANDLRDQGLTLAIAVVRLDAYRDRAIDSVFLGKLAAGFAAVRAAGMKVILRFSYNAALTADAAKSRILGHVAQLAPILNDNGDVIAVMQAGFIGAWGEWHSSTNGLDNSTDRSDILQAILDALPASRSVQVRTPMFKDAIFPGGALTEAEAFTAAPRARVGHHNDCFLASDNDLGTFANPVEDWVSFVEQDGRFTPIGGETCAINAPRSECSEATSEMESQHWSYLNLLYHQSVVDGWKTQGCYDEVRRRLGYRLALDRARYTTAVPPGGELAVSFVLANHGYAALYNRRPVYVVLSNTTTRMAARLDAVDPRRWAPGVPVEVTTRLRVPAGAAPGAYRLAIWLPDDALALRDDSRYSVAFANEGVWDAATGDNVIVDDLRVDGSAPGPVDPTATAFAEIP